MSHWNYRAVRKVHPDGETTVGIHEAYYRDDKPDHPHSITELPVDPSGETLSELREDLTRMLASLEKPVLNYEEFDPPSVKPSL